MKRALLLVAAFSLLSQICQLGAADVCDRNPEEVSKEKLDQSASTVLALNMEVMDQFASAAASGASAVTLARLLQTFMALDCLGRKIALERGWSTPFGRLKGKLRIVNKLHWNAANTAGETEPGECFGVCVAMTRKRWCGLAEPDDLLSPGGTATAIHEGVHLGQDEPILPQPDLDHLDEIEKIICEEELRIARGAANELEAMIIEMATVCLANDVCVRAHHWGRGSAGRGRTQEGDKVAGEGGL